MFSTATVSARDMQRNYKSVVARVQQSNKPVIVISRNKPQMALIKPEELERLQRIADFSVFYEVQAKNADKDPDEVYRIVTQAVEEVRAELYEQRPKSRPR